VYVTDADNREVLEYDGTSGHIQRWYAYGSGLDDVLNQMNVTTGKRATLIPDIQGSVLATLDSATGALTKAGYLAYGENPSATNGTFHYTGRRLDGETAGSTAQPSGLYYYRARMYSPTLARFLQTDPVGYDAGLNLYAYVNNDPLNRADPSGKYWASSAAQTTFQALVPQYGISTGAAFASAAATLAGQSGAAVAAQVPFQVAAKSPPLFCQNVECGAPSGGVVYPLCPSCNDRLKNGGRQSCLRTAR
jgi:RHS repeat-associated protein